MPLVAGVGFGGLAALTPSIPVIAVWPIGLIAVVAPTADSALGLLTPLMPVVDGCEIGVVLAVAGPGVLGPDAVEELAAGVTLGRDAFVACNPGGAAFGVTA